MVAILAGLLVGLVGCTLPPPASQNGPTGASAQPTSIVQAFLEAIAVADATTALTFIANPPSDTSLMTDAVLDQSLQLAAISDISTTASNSDGTITEADYQMGDTSVRATFHLRTVAQGYAITDGVLKMDLTGACTPCTGIALNGVPITQPSVNLFPGTYQFGASSPLLAVTADTFSFTGAWPPPWPTVSVKLASGADATLGAAAQAVIDPCLQEKAIPTSCGFGVPLLSGVTLVADSVTYKPDYSYYKPLTEVGCRLHNPNTTEAICNTPLIIDYSVKDTAGQPFSGEIDAFVTATIDISDPNHLVATLSGF